MVTGSTTARACETRQGADGRHGAVTTAWATNELRRQLDRFEADERVAGCKYAPIRTHRDPSRTRARSLARTSLARSMDRVHRDAADRPEWPLW